MALPSSGQITLDQMHVEVGGSTGTLVTINDADIRGLIGKSAGVQMAFDEWYGASARVAVNLTLSSNTNNYNIYSNRGGSYSAGKTDVTLTINSGVTVGYYKHWNICFRYWKWLDIRRYYFYYK